MKFISYEVLFTLHVQPRSSIRFRGVFHICGHMRKTADNADARVASPSVLLTARARSRLSLAQRVAVLALLGLAKQVAEGDSDELRGRQPTSA